MGVNARKGKDVPTYKVIINGDAMLIQHTRIVKAKTKAQAEAFVARDTIKASKLEADEAFKLFGDGIKLEDATNVPDLLCRTEGA